jgi:AcrR family transcriptional regulator
MFWPTVTDPALYDPNSKRKPQYAEVLMNISSSQAIVAADNPSVGLLVSVKMAKKVMSSDKPTKHELKTQKTRELLLNAAEQIIIRDGYEKADLAEIAKLAGRTKGAIYAQFKSKEDVFLALVQEKALNRRAILQKLVASSTSTEGNIAAFRKYFLEYAIDDVWGFLWLEFKLYTIRHPESLERLRKLYESILPLNEEFAYSTLMGPSPKGGASIKRIAALHSAFAMLTALQLEARFNPSLISKSVLKEVATNLFDSMFGNTSPRK